MYVNPRYPDVDRFSDDMIAPVKPEGEATHLLPSMARSVVDQRWYHRLWPFSRFYDYERRLTRQRVELADLGRRYALECDENRKLKHFIDWHRGINDLPEAELRKRLQDQDQTIVELTKARDDLFRTARALRDQLRAHDI